MQGLKKTSCILILIAALAGLSGAPLHAQSQGGEKPRTRFSTRSTMNL